MHYMIPVWYLGYIAYIIKNYCSLVTCIVCRLTKFLDIYCVMYLEFSNFYVLQPSKKWPWPSPVNQIELCDGLAGLVAHHLHILYYPSCRVACCLTVDLSPFSTFTPLAASGIQITGSCVEVIHRFLIDSHIKY